MEIAFDSSQGKLRAGFRLLGFRLVTGILASVAGELAETRIDFRELRFLGKTLFDEAGNRLALIADEFDLPVRRGYLCGRCLGLLRILLDSFLLYVDLAQFLGKSLLEEDVFGANGILRVFTALGKAGGKADLLLPPRLVLRADERVLRSSRCACFQGTGGRNVPLCRPTAEAVGRP
ncbi:hypothetical protein Q644_22395 [Brucella intermedia 229E]|uniref:Uncharacterized protein n=1 Tax=Brucella intermedia 229E TaxID=1337887 RepID=U4V5M4_9HYPH|nr:hypothetical protein Q644_22395 [Brucella intermedia 229E]